MCGGRNAVVQLASECFITERLTTRRRAPVPSDTLSLACSSSKAATRYIFDSTILQTYEWSYVVEVGYRGIIT
jgi:hypothetical protein